jgi:hypothetical protein
MKTGGGFVCVRIRIIRMHLNGEAIRRVDKFGEQRKIGAIPGHGAFADQRCTKGVGHLCQRPSRQRSVDDRIRIVHQPDLTQAFGAWRRQGEPVGKECSAPDRMRKARTGNERIQVGL